MSPGIAASPQQNGAAVVPSDTRRVTEFYDKILRLRDDVFAGKHERIRLVDKVLEQVAPRSAQPTPSLPNRPSTNGTSAPASAPHPLPPRPDNTSGQSFKTNGQSSHLNEQSSNSNGKISNSNGNFITSHTPQQRSFATARSAPTAIDPRLLTKSDTLIRAELQLKRNNIERSLNDEVEKLEKRSQNRDTFDDSLIDVEQVFAKALELVKPVSGLQAPTNGSERTGSFDENSYYSSQVNSWSSADVDSNNQVNVVDATEPRTVLVESPAMEAELRADKPSAPGGTQPVEGTTSLIDLEEEAYEPADVIEVYDPSKDREEQEDQESEYSPPPAEITPDESCPALGPPARGLGTRRNAARPSRRQSPIGPPQLSVRKARKRRREENREKRAALSKPVARSPQLIIKEESMSPPPLRSLSDIQPSKRQRRDNERERGLHPLPGDVEVVSARDIGTQSGYLREQEPPLRAYRRHEEPQSPTIVHVPQRRLERGDHDLRRVASVQFARRPYSPTNVEPAGYISDARPLRGLSHAVIDRGVEPVYQDISARPSATPRLMRERSRSPVREYLTRPQSPLIMAPPPRRIVVDQYGNKYYAEPVSVRESAAPPSRRIEPEAYYERAVTREPVMRAPARTELYEEADMRRMAPPPPRRFVEQQDVEMLEPGYGPRTLRPLDTEYAPAREIVERRPVVQYEEMGPPREYLPSRAFSVRPEVVRREAGGEYAQARHESVQPGLVRAAPPRYREVSVVPEQLHYDDRRYTMAPPAQGRRYVEDGYVERPIEVPEQQQPFARETRRVSHRY